jgi:hypothetical protein
VDTPYWYQYHRKRQRRRLWRHHLAYIRTHYPHRRFALGWRKTSTMLVSRVFAKGGKGGVMVTTLLINGRVRHAVESF